MRTDSPASLRRHGPLAGLTVLEIPGGVATRYCGRLFAYHGATVLQAGVPEHEGVGYGGAMSAAYNAWLDAGKQQVDEDTGTALRGLAGKRVDLVIAGQSPAAVGAVDAALRAAGLAAAPRVGLTWFAADGPYREWTGSDALIQAMSGVAYMTGHADRAPLLPRGHAPQVAAGTTAFIAGLAAAIGRARGWSGQRIDMDILTANLCFTENQASALSATGGKAVRLGLNRFSSFPGGIYRASNGWIGVTALTLLQWNAFCDLIGHPDLARIPENAVSAKRMAKADALDAILVPALAQRSAEYWLQEGQARRVPMAPVPTLAELPLTPHWQERRAFAHVPGSVSAVGPTMPFHMQERRMTAPASVPASVPPLPLCGVRVLDLSMGWSGPLAARHFADLGAAVIKVESCTHFDWWRGFDGDMNGDPPPYETRPAFLMVNRNKRGITLDLKSAAGVALVRRLAARADVMIENYAPGVLDKLGIGAATLADANPGLICISMGAFGAAGPWRGFRAYGSTVEQASGLPFVNGDPQDPPTMQHTAYGDPVAGLYAASACLIALWRNQRERVSTVIDLAQVECLFQLGADAIIAQSVRTDLLPRTGSRHPLSALRTVIPCVAPDTWLAVSIETMAQWNVLATIVDQPDLQAAAGTPVSALKRHETAMEAAIGAWAASREQAAATEELQHAGIAAGPVRPAHALARDPQLAAAGHWRRGTRRYVGEHVVPLAPYRLDDKTPPLANPSPTLGEHNEEVLSTELGLSPAEIEQLRATGVIGTRAILGRVE